jgi:hypothetical protein
MTEFVMTRFAMEPTARDAEGTTESLGMMVSRAAISRPIETTEYLFCHDNSFGDFQIFSVNFDASPMHELAYNFDPWALNCEDMFCDGQFLWYGYGTRIYQLGWDGKRFVRLSVMTLHGTNALDSIAIKTLNEGRNIHGSATSYYCDVMTVQYPIKAPWRWSPYWGELDISGGTNKDFVWFADFKWKLPAHTSGRGDLIVGLPLSAADPITVLSIEGITVSDYDVLVPGAFGASSGSVKGRISFDRDTGQIAYMHNQYTYPQRITLFEVDLDLPQGAPLSYLSYTTDYYNDTSTTLTSVIGMCNGYICVFSDEGVEGGSWLRTYKYDGSWTNHDNFDLTGIQFVDDATGDFGGYCYTSPYTGKLYLQDSTALCFDIDDSGNVTFLFETVYNGYDEITTYPKMPDVWYDGSTVMDGLVCIWEFDDDEDDNVPRPPMYWYWCEFQGTTGTPVTEYEGFNESLFEWFRWSVLKTAGSDDPYVSSYPGYLRVTGGTGAWPGTITYGNFGNHSDGYIESYILANGGVDGDSAGVVIRMTDIDNFIYAYIKPSEQTLTLAKVENGTETVIDQQTISGMTTTTGGLGYIYVQFNGPDISVRLTHYQLADENFYVSGSTTFQQDAVLHGVQLAGYNGATTQAGRFRFSPWIGIWDSHGSVNGLQYGTTWNTYDHCIGLDIETDPDTYLSMTTTGTGFDSTGAFTLLFFWQQDYRLNDMEIGDRVTLMKKGDPTSSSDNDVDWHFWFEKNDLGQSNTGVTIGFDVKCGSKLYSVESDFFESLTNTDLLFACYYDPDDDTIGWNLEGQCERQVRANPEDPYPYRNYPQDVLHNGWVTTKVSGTRNNNYSTVLLGGCTNQSGDPRKAGGIWDKVQLYNRKINFDELLWVGNLLQQAPYDRGSRLTHDYPRIPAPFPSIKVIGDADSQGATVTSLDIPKPNGIESGDLLLVFAGSDATEATDTLSTSETGFTKIGEFGGEGSRVAAWWKIADGSETDFTISSSTTDELIGYYIVMESADGTTPIIDFAGATGVSNTPQIYDSTWANDINVSDLFMALSFIVTDGSDVVSDETTGPTVWTKLLSVAPEGGGSDCGGYLSMQNYLNVAEPSDDNFVSSTNDGWATLVVAVKGVGW